jgi:hypothetical protein
MVAFLMKTIYPIMGIMTVALILVIAEAYLIFTVVVPLPEILPGRDGILITSAVKVVISGILVLLWIFVLWQLTMLYMRSKVYVKEKPT